MTLKYAGYETAIHFDEEAGVYHGEIVGISDVVTFQARSLPELETALAASVDDYLNFCRQRGEPPNSSQVL